MYTHLFCVIYCIKLYYFANEVEIGETYDILVGAIPPSTIP